jgi:hypothetical protein
MPNIVDTLRNVDDADARLIAHLGALTFEIEYIREDVKSQYSDGDFDEAYQQIMANQVSGDEFRKIIGEEFEAQTLFFEDIVVLVLPSARYEAIFATFDRHESLPINYLIRVATEAEF